MVFIPLPKYLLSRWRQDIPCRLVRIINQYRKKQEILEKLCVWDGHETVIEKQIFANSSTGDNTERIQNITICKTYVPTMPETTVFPIA
jgi:hypothetical protein